ncbi:MAG: Nitrilase/cyanide hydratase and apolipoprotein N-acyltransferase [uncultured bacterium]|nr:MAG: Nitrilase/cyanide hydratase and apolipoprotein N-acyltransferase [uncultured bacterium]HBG18334.1 hypothetical protein [Desulfobulbaceae bacterium]
MKIQALKAPLRTIRVAAVQYQANQVNKAGNLQELEKLIMQAAQAGAKLVVLPEMCTTGLLIGDRKNASNLAETIPGPTANSFSELAERFNIYIIFGLITQEGDIPHFHNSQVLLSSTGQILACYNKRHLFGPDWHWADPGTNGFKAVPTNLGVIGLGICYDINFNDIWAFLLGSRVDIFAFSTNWVEECSPLPFWEMAARQSGIILIAANNWGGNQSIGFSGESGVMCPIRGMLASCGPTGDSVVIADVYLAAVH